VSNELIEGKGIIIILFFKVPRVISYGNFLEGAYTKMGVSFRGKKNRGLVGYSLHSLKNEHASKY
jgi:hypothetical protein